MDSTLMFILGFLLGAIILYIFYSVFVKKGYIKSMESSRKIIEDAKRDAEILRARVESEANKRVAQMILEVNNEVKEKREETRRALKRINYREDLLDKKEKSLHSKESELYKRESDINDKQKSMDIEEKEMLNKKQEISRQLEKVANMSSREAKQQLIESVKESAMRESVEVLRKIEEETLETAKEKSSKILALTCDRISNSFINEKVSSTVSIPSDDMKGRIIGREGRNIRSFENVTGVDVIVDDTPEVVVLSSFNTYRRKIAQVALERLIVDGRIHPVKIEATVKKVKHELDEEAMSDTKKILFELNIGNINPNIIRLLAKLKFRTSYTQNILAHSVEVAYTAGIMASELGLRTKLAKRMGLLHDIGKALDQEAEGSHPELGADVARRYNEPEEVVNAILSHHGGIAPSCPESVLVSAADTLSAARPGARSELLANYIKRITELETVAKGFPNVKECYAIQAGREVRVIVNPDNINDDETYLLAKEIASEIKNKVTYPGEVKVTAIREIRATEIAA